MRRAERRRRARTGIGIAALERLEALIANPALYELAEQVPAPPREHGGRPRMYPPWMWILYDALLSVYGSARQVEAELAHPIIWNHLRSAVRRRFPDQPDRWLPATPMRRHHYLYGRTTWLTRPDVLRSLRDTHQHTAVATARDIGLLDPFGPGSHTHPDLSRMLYADGKVITPLFKAHPGDTHVNKETGEIRVLRADPDGALHFEGDGETHWGTKFVLTAVRSLDVHGRVILDAAWVPTPGGEAATAIDAITHLAPQAPGALGVIYDTALRGTHHQTLLRDLGLLPINRVTAKKARDPKPRRKGGRREEKSAHLEDRTITLPDGANRTISLFVQGGALGVGVLTDTGGLTFTELARTRTRRHTDKQGYRWYNTYRLPHHLGGGEITVRLHGTDDDAKRGFNRTENLRPIAPTDPDFKDLYRRRNDAESINRALDDTLWLRRAHSIGHQRQQLNLLTYALGINSLALARHHQHHGDPPLPLAA